MYDLEKVCWPKGVKRQMKVTEKTRGDGNPFPDRLWEVGKHDGVRRKCDEGLVAKEMVQGVGTNKQKQQSTSKKKHAKNNFKHAVLAKYNGGGLG